MRCTDIPESETLSWLVPGIPVRQRALGGAGGGGLVPLPQPAFTPDVPAVLLAGGECAAHQQRRLHAHGARCSRLCSQHPRPRASIQGAGVQWQRQHWSPWSATPLPGPPPGCPLAQQWAAGDGQLRLQPGALCRRACCSRGQHRCSHALMQRGLRLKVLEAWAKQVSCLVGYVSGSLTPQSTAFPGHPGLAAMQAQEIGGHPA